MAESASKQPCHCLWAALGSLSHPMSLPGRLPGCKGSAGSSLAVDGPSGGGVRRKERGEKARDHERGTASCRSTSAVATLGQAPFSIAQGAAEIASPKVPKSHHPREPGRRARAHPSAAGPADAWSRCPAAWPPGCGKSCPLGLGGPGQDSRWSVARMGMGPGTRHV